LWGITDILASRATQPRLPLRPSRTYLIDIVDAAIREGRVFCGPAVC
jgi:hypothetical protein